MKTKNWYKGLTATAITLAMAGAALTVPAMAIDYDLNYGDVYVGEDETGVWSGQSQDGGNTYFHYEQIGTDGQYEFISGKYQHTNSDGQTDTEINISQGFVDSMTDNNTETETVPDDGAEFDQVAVPDAGSETTDNTVTVSGDLTGKDTDETNDVDITISDVNVDIGAKKDFITVENGTTANITIEHSTVETEGSVVDIGSGSDVTLNLNGETTVDENGTEVDGSNEFTSLNGITVTDSELTINHDGINDFTSVIEDDEVLSENGRFTYSGLFIDGSVVSVNGADADAYLTFSGYQNGVAVSSDANHKSSLEIQTGTVELSNSQAQFGIGENGTTINGNTGNGIFVSHNGKGDFDLVVKGSADTEDYDTKLIVEKNEGGGIAFYNVKAENNSHLRVENAELSSSNNIGVGLYVESGSVDVDVEFDNSLIHINNNGNNGVTGQNTYVTIDNGSQVYVEGNAAIGMNNTDVVMHDSFLSVSGNGSHGWSNGYFDMYNSTGVFSGNRYYGLNITELNPAGKVSQIINSELIAGAILKVPGEVYTETQWVRNPNTGEFEKRTKTATEYTITYLDKIPETDNENMRGNGWSSLRFGAGADIIDSVVNASYGGFDWSGNISTTDSAYNANINIMKTVNVTDSVLISTNSPIAISLYNNKISPAYLNVNASSVLSLASDYYDLYDDWNSKKANTGRTVVSGGSLQAALKSMYNFYVYVNADSKLTEKQLANMTDLEVYLYLCELYGKNVNASVDMNAGNRVDDSYSKDETVYAGPVNKDGTLLFQFELNGKVLKGKALTDNSDGTYTFTYYDPNTGNEVAYTFRYNTNEEDLTGTGDHAYVWTPVTIIHYNPLNNNLNESTNTTAHINRDDNTATDVTIFGTTINLAEKNMPSYDAKVDTDVTTTTDANGATVTTTTTTTSTFGWWVRIENGKLVDLSDEVPGENATPEEWDEFYSLLNYQVTEETDLLALCGGNTNDPEDLQAALALAENITVYGMWTSETEQTVVTTPAEPEIPEPPYIPDYPELPDYDPPEVDIDDPDVPLVEEPEEPEEPEQPTEEIDDEETPLTPSIPDEVVDEIIAEIEDEVTPLTSVPKTGAEMPAATAALPAGALALAVAALVRRAKKKN